MSNIYLRRSWCRWPILPHEFVACVIIGWMLHKTHKTSLFSSLSTKIVTQRTAICLYFTKLRYCERFAFDCRLFKWQVTRWDGQIRSIRTAQTAERRSYCRHWFWKITKCFYEYWIRINQKYVSKSLDNWNNEFTITISGSIFPT